MAGPREHDVERGWLGLSEAGRYANIRPDVLRAAIIAGELEAHEKPVTVGRKGGAARRNALLRIHREDIDRYIRDYWPRADASTFGASATATAMELGEAE